jgi:hypothetical protein
MRAFAPALPGPASIVLPQRETMEAGLIRPWPVMVD